MPRDGILGDLASGMAPSRKLCARGGPQGTPSSWFCYSAPRRSGGEHEGRTPAVVDMVPGLLVVCLATTLAAVGGLVVVQRLVPSSRRAEHNDVAGFSASPSRTGWSGRAPSRCSTSRRSSASTTSTTPGGAGSWTPRRACPRPDVGRAGVGRRDRGGLHVPLRPGQHRGARADDRGVGGDHLLSLFTVAALDYPFGRGVQVGPEAFEQVLGRFESGELSDL
jgi:hypothetical protein